MLQNPGKARIMYNNNNVANIVFNTGMKNNVDEVILFAGPADMFLRSDASAFIDDLTKAGAKDLSPEGVKKLTKQI